MKAEAESVSIIPPGYPPNIPNMEGGGGEGRGREGQSNQKRYAVTYTSCWWRAVEVKKVAESVTPPPP